MSGNNTPRLIEIAKNIITLEKQKTIMDENIKEAYADAKSCGYDSKVLKRAIKYVQLEEKDQKRYHAENDMFNLYVEQLGLPL